MSHDDKDDYHGDRVGVIRGYRRKREYGEPLSFGGAAAPLE